MAERINFKSYSIAAVIPAYRVEREIESVLSGLPSYLKYIIVVDDASPDRTGDLAAAVARRDRRLILLRHTENRGVGGAMISGFRKALELGAQIVVKIDGDGQMDIENLPDLLTPLILGRADYTKGNRFRDFASLRHMPWIRRVGNMGLGFLAKAATGYWNLFDPTNGFLADPTYYFETSMLAHLYLLSSVVQDIPMAAHYKSEVSSLLIHRILLEFPLKLCTTLVRRAVLKNFIYDFSMESIYLLTGLPLLVFGVAFGSYKWIQYASLGIPAPTGTVILPTLSVLLGIQLMLSAIEIDLRSVPQKPLSASLV